MKVFTVMEPPDAFAGGDNAEDRAVRSVFIKDGIAWWALFFPMIWLLFHRLWLGFLGYLVYAIVLVSLGFVLDETGTTIIGLLGALLFALEANTIRRWTLERRGWTLVGEAAGRNRAEAEYAFFAARDESLARPGAALANKIGGESGGPKGMPVWSNTRRSEAARPGGEGSVLGLFPEPER